MDYGKNLTWGTSGNISVRLENRVFLTASGSTMGRLKEEDIVVVDLDGRSLEETKKPSKETGMHLAVYQKCPDVQAIIHASPFYSTMFGCCDAILRKNLFIESMYYDESVLRIPYFHAGSSRLAEAVGNICDKTHVILMENHGVLVYDRSLSECRTCLEITENLCRMNLLAETVGLGLREVPEKTVEEFLTGGYYKKR